MIYQINYAALIDFDRGRKGIEIPVTLRCGGKSVTNNAKLDTGSTDCIFERWQGEMLGLDIESGSPQKFSTATGIFQTYQHWVSLSVAHLAFDVPVYFAKDYEFNRNILGRHGFTQITRFGLIDYDGKLFLSHRDDE